MVPVTHSPSCAVRVTEEVPSSTPLPSNRSEPYVLELNSDTDRAPDSDELVADAASAVVAARRFRASTLFPLSKRKAAIRIQVCGRSCTNRRLRLPGTVFPGLLDSSCCMLPSICRPAISVIADCSVD